jgi:ABC-type Fe3+-hydroxamate transport system substrate-binding protein
VETLAEAGIPVFLGAPETVDGAIQMLRDLGGRVEAPLAADLLVPVERVLKKLRTRRTSTRRVFVPIWKSPYMGVGSDTYVHDVLKVSGGENVCGRATRYPVVALEEIEALRPEVILLPDEPYPFSAEDLPEFYALDVPAAKEDRIHLVDGKLLTWYGPRMASSLTQISALLGF